MDILLFLLGYCIQCLACGMLCWKIYKSKSIYGLSIDTQIAFAIANVTRCIWTLDTRLIETNFAFLELVCSTIVSLFCVYLCWTYHHTTTMHAIPWLRIYTLTPIAAVLAFFFHPSDQWFSVQILVAFTMYLEALGLLPQLWLMKKMYDVEPITSHYVGTTQLQILDVFNCHIRGRDYFFIWYSCQDIFSSQEHQILPGLGLSNLSPITSELNHRLASYRAIFSDGFLGSSFLHWRTLLATLHSGLGSYGFYCRLHVPVVSETEKRRSPHLLYLAGVEDKKGRVVSSTFFQQHKQKCKREL
ncbi:unnamed protein product [Amoebophrya sp. A25]|nr:unnamed protein product [Amoebophrya sp. A25]|eukprot:GSA25T00000511001.1